MKKSYSVILLVSFLIGALQPVLPMIEYQLFRGSIIELLGEVPCEGEQPVKVLSIVQGKSCTSKNNPNQELLDTDYYPLAVQIMPVPSPSVFLSRSEFHPPQIQKIANPSYLPNSPPPQVS